MQLDHHLKELWGQPRCLRISQRPFLLTMSKALVKSTNVVYSLVAWTTLWQMSLSRGKCKILNVYRSKNPIIHQYTMNGVPLDTVTHHP